MLENLAARLSMEEKELKDYEKLTGWLRCAEIEAVNWTPWWGGDHEAKVRDPESLKPTSKPTSETIKGVMRWVLRAALATHIQSDYTTLDQLLAPIYGGVARRGRREEHLDSLVRVNVETSIDYGHDQRIITKAIKDIEACRGAGSCDPPPQVYSIIGKRTSDEQDAYRKILTSARVRLAMMKRSREGAREVTRRRKSLLPIPPNCLKLKILIEISSKLSSIPQINMNTICHLTLCALLYALIVRGVGRGATRGFGRFKIERLECPLCSDKGSSFRKLVAGLLDPAKAKIELTELHKRIIEEMKPLLKALQKQESTSIEKGKSCDRCTPSLKPIGDPLNAPGVIIRVVRSAKHPGGPRQLAKISKLGVTDVYDALSAISWAFVKNVWKRKSSITEGEVRATGIGFHSWLAGLPRFQQNTGYAVIYKQKLNEIIRNERCLHNSCLDVEDVKDLRRKGWLGEGRRISTILAYPLPESPSTIVVIAYVSLGDHVAKLGKGDSRLYHIGRHGDLRASCRHVVDVAWASRREQVSRPPGNCSPCSGSGCGADSPAGIVFPEGLEVANDVQDLIIKAYSSVLEHVLNALS